MTVILQKEVRHVTYLHFNMKLHFQAKRPRSIINSLAMYDVQTKHLSVGQRGKFA